MTDEQSIIGPTGTQIYSDGQHTTIRFRDREVVWIAYLDVQLDAGGSHDFVTQSRLNQGSRLFDLGYHVVTRAGVWVVRTSKGTYDFQDGMHIRRSLGRDHEYVQYGTNTEPSP
jgi:hypothetical protein